MKFGKSISIQQDGNADLHYMEYKVLKKHIKDVVEALTAKDLPEALGANSTFEEALALEIRHVNECFSGKQKSLLDATATLAEAVQEGAAKLALATASSSSSSSPAAGPPKFIREFIDILGEVDQLRKYAVWNAVAVVKILKKRRKQTSFGLEDAAAERAGWLARQTFFSGADFAELHAAIQSLGYAVMAELSPPEGGSRHTLPTDSEPQQCPICLDTITDVVELECRHRFCWRCYILGPIAAQQEDYRMTQCPLCRSAVTTASSSGQAPLPAIAAPAAASTTALSTLHVAESSSGSGGACGRSELPRRFSEGTLTRFLHTYFPKTADADSDGEGSCVDSEKGSRGRLMSDPETRNVVGELVRALMDGSGSPEAQLAKERRKSSDIQTSITDGSEVASSSGAGHAVNCAGDFFLTLPQRPSVGQQMWQGQKLQWLQLASNNDPLSVDSSMYCSLCSEPLLIEAVITTPCKHHFHRVCLKRLDMPKCPICTTNLPFSWFLPSDHPLVDRGFRVIPSHSYKPLFPGGPSRRSAGFPLHDPPPALLHGPDGLEMKCYLHRIVPTGSVEDDEDASALAFDGYCQSPANACAPAPPALAAAPAAAQAGELSSSQESSSEESGSEEDASAAAGRNDNAEDRLPRRWCHSSLGKMRLLEKSSDAGFSAVAAAAASSRASAFSTAGADLDSDDDADVAGPGAASGRPRGGTAGSGAAIGGASAGSASTRPRGTSSGAAGSGAAPPAAAGAACKHAPRRREEGRGGRGAGASFQAPASASASRKGSSQPQVLCIGDHL